ncbi:major facilitator transporter [Agrobacterium arsenijevicii]|uniref:Major facilitator transporter n=1 Tax=Agrobacterium arsenijevicii TaxID=1585697 RepID=A0ABR5CZV7_9HYPH|nr:MFS transporter [Agrobacterium fabrum]KJF70306.1 major facilitator transporter [Agrobacterium arsenijevicii]
MTQIDVAQVVGASRFNRFHGSVLFWCVLVLVLDGYDLAIVGAALPSIMADLSLTPTQAGFMASSALFGMMFGAIFLGALADRVGRRPMMAFCVGLFSIFTAAAGLTSDPLSFSITRFIAGLGIGGVVPIATAQMAEFSPSKYRGRLITLVFAGYSIGGILVALTSKQLLEGYDWRAVFFTAAVPVVIIPVLLATFPESMAFLIRKGRKDEIARILAKAAPQARLATDAHFVLPRETINETTSVRDLFQGDRAFSTLMIWVAFITCLFMVYALSSWLTKLMAMAGYSLGSALNFVLVYNIGAMIGGVIGGLLVDRHNPKIVLVGFYLAGAASLISMAHSSSILSLYIAVFAVGASTLGTQLVAYAYAGGFYPASIRATGVGFASGLGRLGAICAPLLIGTLVAMNLPLAQNFYAIALAGLIGAGAVMLIDQRRSAANLDRHRLPATGTVE